jgi:hypothetical protein
MSHDRSQASRPQDAQHFGQTHALKEVVREALCLDRRLVFNGLGKNCHEAFHCGSLRRHLGHEPSPAGRHLGPEKDRRLAFMNAPVLDRLPLEVGGGEGGQAIGEIEQQFQFFTTVEVGKLADDRIQSGLNAGHAWASCIGGRD